MKYILMIAKAISYLIMAPIAFVGFIGLFLIWGIMIVATGLFLLGGISVKLVVMTVEKLGEKIKAKVKEI